ncbi:transcription initiation factor TFIID subunit 3 [Massospora cicadina]|nr:transcription initiation factor TFIID subunit 3 [Massospora cicadina]
MNDLGTMMVSCDSCEQWFHGLCVGILSKEELPSPWYCERCLHRNSKQHTHPASEEVDYFNLPYRDHMLNHEW